MPRSPFYFSPRSIRIYAFMRRKGYWVEVQVQIDFQFAKVSFQSSLSSHRKSFSDNVTLATCIRQELLKVSSASLAIIQEARRKSNASMAHNSHYPSLCLTYVYNCHKLNSCSKAWAYMLYSTCITNVFGIFQRPGDGGLKGTDCCWCWIHWMSHSWSSLLWFSRRSWERLAQILRQLLRRLACCELFLQYAMQGRPVPLYLDHSSQTGLMSFWIDSHYRLHWMQH